MKDEMTMEDDRRLPRVIVLFVLLVVAPLHLYLENLPREPYPALFMPRFAGVPVQDGAVRYRSPEVLVDFSSGQQLSLTADELLDVPVSDVAVLTSTFSTGLDAEGELTETGPADVLRRVLVPGSGGRTVDSTAARAHDQRTKRWLRERLSELAPEEDPVEVVIRWRTLQVTLQGEEIEIDPSAAQTVRISL